MHWWILCANSSNGNRNRALSNASETVPCYSYPQRESVLLQALHLAPGLTVQQVNTYDDQHQRPQAAYQVHLREARQHQYASRYQRPPVLALEEPYRAEAEAQCHGGKVATEAEEREALDYLTYPDARHDSAGDEEADAVGLPGPEVGVEEARSNQQRYHPAEAAERRKLVEQEEHTAAYQDEAERGAVAVVLVYGWGVSVSRLCAGHLLALWVLVRVLLLVGRGLSLVRLLGRLLSCGCVRGRGSGRRVSLAWGLCVTGTGCILLGRGYVARTGREKPGGAWVVIARLRRCIGAGVVVVHN